MAWVTYGGGSAWSGAAVYEEMAVGSGTQTKTFQVTLDAGNVAVRPRFIELDYTASATAGTRSIVMTHLRAGDTFHTMQFDDACEIVASKHRRIFLHTGRNTPDNQFSTSDANNFDHMHTLMPLVLLPGDALRFTTTAFHEDDTMLIHIHADVLQHLPKS